MNSIYERDVVFAINIDRSTAELESVRSSDGIFIGWAKDWDSYNDWQFALDKIETIATVFKNAKLSKLFNFATEYNNIRNSFNKYGDAWKSKGAKI